MWRSASTLRSGLVRDAGGGLGGLLQDGGVARDRGLLDLGDDRRLAGGDGVGSQAVHGRGGDDLEHHPEEGQDDQDDDEAAQPAHDPGAADPARGRPRGRGAGHLDLDRPGDMQLDRRPGVRGGVAPAAGAPAAGAAAAGAAVGERRAPRGGGRGRLDGDLEGLHRRESGTRAVLLVELDGEGDASPAGSGVALFQVKVWEVAPAGISCAAAGEDHAGGGEPPLLAGAHSTPVNS